MKIKFSKIFQNSNEEYLIRLGDSSIVVSDAKYVLNIKSGNKQLFFEGELYYYLKEDKTQILKKNEYESFLKNKIENFDAVEFINSVEGIYNCLYVDNDKKEVTIFCDYLNRKNLFYKETSNSFVVSTNLINIVTELPKIKYNQAGLLSYLNMGYTPIHHTFYEGVERFKSNEFIKITNGKVNFEQFSENYSIRNYDNSFIDTYDELISNSILSRSSEKNYVLNSGGWDSTSIIYHLLKANDSKNIYSIVYETKLSSGDIYNIYEVDKVKRISEYYGIKSDKIVIDFNDKKLLSDWESIKEEMKNYHTYFFVDMPKAVNYIALRNDNTNVFSGEAADSIHNFGFSQFVSVTYQNKQLRAYGDKMKSYLFSPSFFSKVIDETFPDDKVFQFFKFYFSSDNFEFLAGKNKAEKLNSYFQSFMLSAERVPFAKTIMSAFANDLLISDFNSALNKNIFNSVSTNARAENFYYYLLQLYRTYHFHSPQIEVKHTPLRSSGNNCKIPFLDSLLVKFMYSMPENWGRGLELRPTKYPLRYLAANKWNIPVSILEETGAHSYIAEADKKWNYSGGSWSLAAETIYNSVFGEYYKSILSEVSLEKYFSPNCFNTDLMTKVVKDFVKGKQDLNHSSFIYKLGVLFFIGLYE